VVLPTSSRPPPAGQDAVEFVEGEMKHIEYQGGKEICYDSGKSFQGTPQSWSCQNPIEISSKYISTQENIAFRESCNAASQRAGSGSCSQHLYENWRTSFESLLYDTDGRHVFCDYLTREGHAILLDCLGSCEFFRTLPLTNDLYISARDFYKRFIQFRDPKLHLRDLTRNKVNQYMRSNSYHSLMFEDVERDVLNELKCTWYDKFLLSDFYLNYCLSANPDHGARNFVPSSKGLGMPTVEEEGTGDFGEKDGAHVKEFREKSINFTDELSRRSLQETNAPHQHSEQTNIIPKSDNDSRDADAICRDPRSAACTAMPSELMGGKRERQQNNAHEDNLPSLPHFKPRTERIKREAMRPMKPEEFAKILCEKLEKVIIDRESAEKAMRETDAQILEDVHGVSHSVGESVSQMGSVTPLCPGDENTKTRGSCRSHGSYPQSDRYSVAGMSSVSGSEVKSDSQLKYRHGAKELASAVHHALRNELKECTCKQCLDKQKTYRKMDNPVYIGGKHQNYDIPPSAHCPCCKHLQNVADPYTHQRNNNSPSVKLTSSNLEALKIPPSSADNERIYSWIEHNEKYRSEMAHPHVADSPSDTPTAKRRHRPPVIYNTTRPGSDYHAMKDSGTSLDPYPYTNVVLEEAKRRLEDNSRGVSRSSRKPGRSSSRSHQQCIDPEYAETTLSGATGNWTLSESASSVSRNQVPSIISSSIPSSASQYINESISDLHSESARSHGSGGSKGHHKDKTVVTYFLGIEPIPYRTSLPGKNITLGQFRTLITKKGNFRYFFKTKTKDDGIVYQQIEDDDDFLPKFDSKIVCKIKKVEH